MGSALPDIPREAFDERLQEVSPLPLDSAQRGALWSHFQLLRRWNARLSLVGPGTAGDVVERHFGEALAGVPLLRPSDQTVVDVGSGGGFPGLILAIARPGLSTYLVEPKQRKWSFLMSSIRRCAVVDPRLSCQAVNARVERPLPVSLVLPPAIDVVTSRALAFSASMIEALRAHSPRVRFLLWASDDSLEIPAGLRLHSRLELQGSTRRHVVALEPVDLEPIGSLSGD